MLIKQIILVQLICSCVLASEEGLTEESPKIKVDWPFLGSLAFEKLEHIQLYAHYGRIVGHIVINRHAQSAEILQDFLAACDLEIVEMPQKPAMLAALAAQNYLIHEVDFNTMVSIVTTCQDLQIQRVPPQVHYSTNHTAKSINMWTLLKGIVPGTKWCGVNDLANNYHDLGAGSHFEVDKCCRAHDHCPVKVHAFTANYGATNYHPYTKSHCACDDLFYKCLKKLTSDKSNRDQDMIALADAIGRIYFNVFNLECAEPRFPRVCLRKSQSDVAGPQVQTPNVHEKRLWYGMIENYLYGEENTAKDDVCTEWALDTEATPKLIFRKPKLLF